jgi:hypothetical protein
MSALSVNDPEDPRSPRYYAPRQRRVVAREATLQPVLERLRGGTRDYSADERLGGDADPLSSEQPEFVVVPERRCPVATLAAFAGGVTAVAALALGYVVFGANPGSPVADAAPTPPPSAQAPAAPAKIVARVAPNAPVSPMRAPQPMQARVATADATATLPVDPSKGDRLDAPASSPAGTAYDPLQSPIGLWSLSPTQAAIEGANPALAAPVPPSTNAATAAAPPHPVAPEHHETHHAAPVRHHVRHHVRQARHHRHRRAATTGEAVSVGAGQNTAGAANATGGAAQPSAAKKFMGLFGG